MLMARTGRQNGAATTAPPFHSRRLWGSLRLDLAGSARRTGPEGVDPRLVIAESGAARSQHMSLERRDAGGVDQKPIHQSRPGESDPTPRVPACRVDCNHGIGEPADPLKEVVRMPGDAPEPDVTNAATIGWAAAEPGELAIGDAFA